ncbi:MAG TPA: discoidin domain-containing protein [Tepidisphaeraceae bacterium]|nr:discoidin domain-containing protein [Tepidisphaeraceae bacterium]
MSAPITPLPPPIGPYVVRYVRLRRRHALMRGLGVAAAFFLAWGLGCCMIDRIAPLAAGLRLALLATCAVAAVALLFRPLVQWLWNDVNWPAAAAEIERRHGLLAQRLQTVISESLEPPRQGGSRQMVNELAREVGEVLVASRPAALLRWRPTLAPWAVVALLVAAAAGLSRVPTVGLPQLAQRFAIPWRSVPPVTTTRLTLQPLNASVVEGQPLHVTVSAERLGGRGVTLFHTVGSSLNHWSSIPMAPTGTGTFQAIIAPVNDNIHYFARGGDGRSVTGSARVLRRPTLTEMRVRYTYPPYTSRSPLTISNTDGLIEAPTGTKAQVTFVASEPLASAVLTIGDQRLETTPGDSPRERRATLSVTKDQPYALELVSTDNITGSGPGTMMIRGIPDRPPLVQVVQPPGELRLSPRDILSLPFQALDDYGVTSLKTNVQITPSGVDPSGEPLNLAQGKPATQPSTWGGAGAERAVDGNTDGNFPAASVTHTDAGTAAPWWQVDLGNVAPVSVVEIWNRADAVPERLSDFFVFVSDGPFLSDDATAIAQQPGVATHRVTGVAGRPTTIEIFRTARFVRVQLAKPEYLSLAEVRVLQAKAATAAESASRSLDVPLPISGDPRQQEGEAVVDLARIGVAVGDVVSVSVTATDSGKLAGLGGPIRVVVSPRSIDQRTYDRINELKRAAQLSASLVAQLESSAKEFDPAAARNVSRVEAYLAALAHATRELAAVSETAGVLQSTLLRSIIRSDGPELSVALAAMVDGLQRISATSSVLGAKFAFDASPTEADRAALIATVAVAERVAADVATILRGEQAGAVLADLHNLRASERGTPSGKEAADRARERARRVREDVEAAAKELGLSPDAADVEVQLKAMVGARKAAMKAYALPDYAPAAQEYAAAMAARATLPALVPRLSAAAQAEAVRPDGNLVRARDLQLAASAALRVRDAAAATRDEFAASFAQAVAAVQREHAETILLTATAASAVTASAVTAPTPAPATAPATTQPGDAVRAAAEDARRKLSLWARGQSEQSASEAEALARAQELAMQANADLARREYESAEAADERIARELRLAERTFPRAVERFEQARQQVRRSTEKARLLDQLTAQQQQIARRTHTHDLRPVASAQAALAAEMAKAADGKGGAINEFAADADSRLAAVAVIRDAQERLATMPQQLRGVETALGERAAAASRLNALQQQAMPPDEQPAAGRAIRGAEEQLSEAEQRLAEQLVPLGEAVALEMARSLAQYAPETTEAVRGLHDRLRPAMARLQRAASAGAVDAGSAVAELRGAIDGLQTQLKDAQASLLARDPLMAARVYAAAASAALSGGSSSSANHQQNASAALVRAWDATIHEAAAARLAGLPTMRPLFAPPPDAENAMPQPAAASAASRFPMFFEWGRLPWLTMQPTSASPRANEPARYEDALQAYFEALGVTHSTPETSTTRGKP